CSRRRLPPGAGGPLAISHGRTTAAQGHSARRQRAPGRRDVAPSIAIFPRVLAPRGTGTVQDKTATAHTGLGQALASRPPAGTTRWPGGGRAPLQARPAF